MKKDLKGILSALSLIIMLVSVLPLMTACSTPAARESVKVVNMEQGVALKGYDPVAYFTEGKARRGDPAMTLQLRGSKYQFTSEIHREMFHENPDKYLPQYGGYCAYAMAVNQVADINPKYWHIQNERLFLNANWLAQFLWKWGTENNVKKADRNWEVIYRKS